MGYAIFRLRRAIYTADWSGSRDGLGGYGSATPDGGGEEAVEPRDSHPSGLRAHRSLLLRRDSIAGALVTGGEEAMCG